MITKQNYITLFVPLLVMVIVLAAIAYAGSLAKRYDQLNDVPATDQGKIFDRLRKAIERFPLALEDGGGALIQAAAVLVPLMGAAVFISRFLRS